MKPCAGSALARDSWLLLLAHCSPPRPPFLFFTRLEIKSSLAIKFCVCLSRLLAVLPTGAKVNRTFRARTCYVAVGIGLHPHSNSTIPRSELGHSNTVPIAHCKALPKRYTYVPLRIDNARNHRARRELFTKLSHDPLPIGVMIGQILRSWSSVPIWTRCDSALKYREAGGHGHHILPHTELHRLPPHTPTHTQCLRNKSSLASATPTFASLAAARTAQSTAAARPLAPSWP